MSKVLFPIGEYKKTEVRKLAKKLGLPTADKPDSQGICFVGTVNISDFLRETIKEKPGNIVDYDGNNVGKHDGLAFYTIGQREGVGVSKSIPYYVAEKKPDSNKLVVAPLGSDKLFKSILEASEATWTDNVGPKAGEKLKARIRYRQPLVGAVIEKIQVGRVRVKFVEEQKAVTPGQSIVFYDEEEVLGGAIIN